MRIIHLANRPEATDWSKVDWSLSTGEIARRVGVTPSTVSLQRMKRAPQTKDPARQIDWTQAADWDHCDWTKSNYELSRLYGLHRQTIARARRFFAPETPAAPLSSSERRAQPAEWAWGNPVDYYQTLAPPGERTKRGPRRIDWKQVDWSRPTGDLAQELGVHPHTITRQRSVVTAASPTIVRTAHQVVNGTYYHDSTPAEIVRILENARASKQRLRIFLGDIETGRDWLEEFGVAGTIGRSTGREPSPLMIANSRSTGGGALLDDSIVKIMSGGRVLWQHPRYHTPVMTCENSDEPGYLVDVLANGDIHARFKSKTAFNRWCKFMDLNPQPHDRTPAPPLVEPEAENLLRQPSTIPPRPRPFTSLAFNLQQFLRQATEEVCEICRQPKPLRSLYREGVQGELLRACDECVMRGLLTGRSSKIPGADGIADEESWQALIKMKSPTLVTREEQAFLDRARTRRFRTTAQIKTLSQIKKLSRNAERLIALLENARDLAVHHQRLTQSSKVVKSAAEFAKSLRQAELQHQLDRLAAAVPVKNNRVLMDAFDEACHDVIVALG